MTRLPITKTPKVYVGGAFIRSESGRTFALKDAAGKFFANIPQCTRKDLRNAVEAAAKAGPGLGEAHAVQPRADPLPPRRDARGAPRRDGRGGPAGRGDAAGRGQRRSPPPSTG